MKSFVQFFAEQQEHPSRTTSLKQVAAGLKYAAEKGLIKPNSHNVDVGGGKFDIGKEHIEKSVEGSQLHVYDPFNRSEEHNKSILKSSSSKAHYVGLHNVLNVIKEPEYRKSALESAKSFMHPEHGIVHITVHEGDRSGKGRISNQDKGSGSSWQEHRKTSSYADEVGNVFPEKQFNVKIGSKHIVISHKK
jgi:hypothetical protein